MGHYAKIENDTVTEVIVAKYDFIEYLASINNDEWIKTSYNTRGGVHYQPNSFIPSEDQSKSLRKNYAGVGFHYDRQKNAFIAPQPFDSWSLNEDTCLWEAPVPIPADGFEYYWDENKLNWIKIPTPDGLNKPE